MEALTSTHSNHSLQTVAFAVFICAICYLLPKISYRTQLARLPLLSESTSGEKQRKAFLKSAQKMYLEGYEKFKDTAYRMSTSDGEENIVIPPQFLPEVRKLSDSVLSFPRAIEKLMETKYTQILTDEGAVIAHLVKADLTPALARLNPVVYSEVKEAMREEIPDCKDWTPVPIYMTLVNMVAKITGRIFVGPDLCRNSDYLDSAIYYTMDLIEAQRQIKLIRPILRPILAPRLPSVQRLRKRERMAIDYIGPIVEERRNAEAKDPNWRKPDDMLSCLMSRAESHGVTSTAMLAKLQLGIIFAAIHTTTMTATNMLYSLAVSPEYIEPLREEVRTVMAEHGGNITARALQQMLKLDSFMKETMRFYPPGLTTFSRKVLKGFTLSNGQYIPPGANIEIPSHAIYQDSTNYANSETFDGFRHYKLRQGGTATDHARNQFVTTNEQNLMFGYGSHACPGRFFAANEIKMLLARLVLDFDIKNEDGSMERYANIETGRSSAPDARKKLLLKRVEI